MSDIYIFGYGSLVNRATHAYAKVFPARLHGWRRVWQHTSLRPAVYLSVMRDDASFIDGLVMQVPQLDKALDARESAYHRVDVTANARHDHPGSINISTYAVPGERHSAPTADHPVLLSYIDVVVQGYHQQFGAPGVQHFFETTHGWDTPIVDDRARPQYPRHQALTRAETDRTDDWLSRLSAVVK